MAIAIAMPNDCLLATGYVQRCHCSHMAESPSLVEHSALAEGPALAESLSLAENPWLKIPPLASMPARTLRRSRLAACLGIGIRLGLQIGPHCDRLTNDFFPGARLHDNPPNDLFFTINFYGIMQTLQKI